MSESIDPPSPPLSPQYHAELLRFLTWKLGCRDLAANFAQETFLRVARFRSSAQAQEVEHPRQFLFSVAIVS